MKTPAWATKIAEEVCRDAEREAPPIVWRRARAYLSSSSGYTYDDHLVICAVQGGHVSWAPIGQVVRTVSARIDHRLVLLHELAHWLTPGHCHDAIFWRQAWTLYRRYKVPIKYAAYQENSYRNPKLARAAQRETRGKR